MMAQFTQNSTEILTKKLINTVIDNVNTAICFYKKRTTNAMRISVEETVIENLTFAVILADESNYALYIYQQLKQLNEDILKGEAPYFLISTMPLKQA